MYNETELSNSYNSPIVDAIEAMKPEDNGEAETPYFKLHVYGNGNLHITFKRADLVEKLNRAAGGKNRLAA